MSDEPNVTTTTIGPTIVVRGRLTSAEDLVVKGRIDAEITSTKALIIEDSGIVKANVQVRSVRINGILVGNINATDKAEVASGGRVVGDIRAPKLVIADGAAFRGNVDMPDFEERRAASTTDKRRPAAVPAEPAAQPETGIPAEEPAFTPAAAVLSAVAPAPAGPPAVAAERPAAVAERQAEPSLSRPRWDGGRRGRQ